MEYQDKETETVLELRRGSIDGFAKADHYLRSGVHIQNYKFQIKVFQFIEDNYPFLYAFYERMYKAKLTYYQSINGKFFYLEFFDELKSKLSKESLKQKHTLFAIFLYMLHRIEKRFSTTLSKQELIDALNNNHKIKPHLHRLFLGGEKEDTAPTQNTLYRWVSESLKELEKLGWVEILEEDNEQFEILPSLERIGLIYADAINNIEEIKTNNE
jgi:chromosome condensin MukBEF MukE localization factor